MQLANFQNRLEALKSAPPGKKGSQRGEVLGMFLEKLNKAREGTKYPPIKIGRLAVMLSQIKSTSDLRAFYGECDQAKNFSTYFWWKFKIAKNTHQKAISNK